MNDSESVLEINLQEYLTEIIYSESGKLITRKCHSNFPSCCITTKQNLKRDYPYDEHYTCNAPNLYISLSNVIKSIRNKHMFKKQIKIY